MKRLICSLIVVVTTTLASQVSWADKPYEDAVAKATKIYITSLEAAKKQALAAKDNDAADAIAAKMVRAAGDDKSLAPILGQWSWYHGLTTIKADGTCHWKGPNREEHGVWEQAPGYLFDWGEHNNDWNYFKLGADGNLTGKGVKWGGDLKVTRPVKK